MRWVFVGIIALNLLYLGWTVAVGAPDVEAPAAAPSAEVFESPLSLLGEVGSLPAVAEERVVNRGGSGCPGIGPFSVATDAAKLREQLSDAGFDVVVRDESVGAPYMYWVYLPAYGSRPQAVRKLRELHGSGIDSFIVTDGVDANAVSLGLFASKESALSVQARMRAAGHAAEVRQQAGASARHWILFRDPAVQGFAEFIPGTLPAGTGISRRACQ